MILIHFLFRRKNTTPDPFEDLYQRIHDDIKYAVAPKSINLNASVTELVDLATEVWRIEQRLTKVAEILPENQRKGLENSA